MNAAQAREFIVRSDWPRRRQETRLSFNASNRKIPVNEELGRLFREIRKEQGLTGMLPFTYVRRILSGAKEDVIGQNRSSCR